MALYTSLDHSVLLCSQLKMREWMISSFVVFIRRLRFFTGSTMEQVAQLEGNSFLGDTDMYQ